MPMNLSMARSSRRLLLVNSWVDAALAAGREDRGQVVGGHVAGDELLGRRLTSGARKRLRLLVVEDDHVEAAVERLGVRHDVGLDDRLGLERRRFRPLDRDVDLRERRDVLPHAVLEDLEVVALQVRRTGSAGRTPRHRPRRS